jgi:hypothetical protein
MLELDISLTVLLAHPCHFYSYETNSIHCAALTAKSFVVRLQVSDVLCPTLIYAFSTFGFAQDTLCILKCLEFSRSLLGCLTAASLSYYFFLPS